LVLTKIAAFNNVDSVRQLLEEYSGQIAGMIIEPIMMNAGIIMPEAGYLAELKDVLHEHGALFTFDEVKTGLTVGPGGATKVFGVTPDLVCLAKSIGGGLVLGAVGGTEEVMGYVASGVYARVGTFNGNPLSVAVGRTMMEKIATDEAYARIGALHQRIDDSLGKMIAEAGLPAHVVSIGGKGCVTFSTTPVRDYRDFLEIDDRYNHAHWLFQHNGGVFLPPWGKTEQWLISVQHDDADVDRFLANFETFAAAVAG
jgi:glutamate-1-semialdehyde 2,1-aminomutase